MSSFQVRNAIYDMVSLNSGNFFKFFMGLDIIILTPQGDRTHQELQKYHEFFRIFWNIHE